MRISSLAAVGFRARSLTGTFRALCGAGVVLGSLAISSEAEAQTTSIPLSFANSAPPASSSVSVTGLPTAPTGDATLTFQYTGDLAASTETVTVTIDGVLVGVLDGRGDCELFPDEDTFIVPQATLAPLVADGELLVAYQASAAVDNFCDGAPLGAPNPVNYAVTGSITYTGTTPAPVAPPTASDDQLARFAEERSRALLRNQPDIVRFVDGRSGGAFAADVTRGNGSVDMSTAGRGPAWATLSGSWTDGDGFDQSYGLASAGAHLSFGSNGIAGAMLQLDTADRDSIDGSGVSGTGWLIGPYFAAQIADRPLYVHGRLLSGRTDNDVLGAGGATASVNGDRALATLGLEGAVESGGYTLYPNLQFSHVVEDLEGYTDSAGTVVGAQSVGLTEADMGLDFEVPLAASSGEAAATFGVAAIYADRWGSGAAATVPDTTDGWRARVDAGYRHNVGSGMAFKTGVFAEGLGDSRSETYGASLTLDLAF